MRFGIYIAMAIATVSPLIWKNRGWIRYGCLVIIAAFGLLHLMHLIAGHRIALEQASAQLGIGPQDETPEALHVSIRAMADLNHNEIPLFAAMFGSLMILAGIPRKEPSQAPKPKLEIEAL